MKSKYLIFKQLFAMDEGPKFYEVWSRTKGIKLGEVEWYFPWRQYVFYPEAGTLWNNTCLNDIASFLEELMAERKKAEEVK